MKSVLEDGLAELPGVHSAAASIETGNLLVLFEPVIAADRIVARIAALVRGMWFRRTATGHPRRLGTRKPPMPRSRHWRGQRTRPDRRRGHRPARQPRCQRAAAPG